MIAIIALLIGILLPALGEARRAAKLAISLSNLRQFSIAAATYASDFEDRIYAFTAAPNSTYPDIRELARTGTPIRQAVGQQIDIIRRRTGRDNFPIPERHIPHVLYSHLILNDYLAQRLPEKMVVSPEDEFRINWQIDPVNNHDLGVWQPYQEPQDGNGRIHRFLIHNILARHGFTPNGIMFPVSAGMLNNLTAYDASLEAFSLPLLPLVDYVMAADGRMTVTNDTGVWYEYPDLTAQCETLFSFIELTINTELADALSFLANYDASKEAIQEVVDMPNRQIDLFIRFCLQNKHRLSSRKRASHFGVLSAEEIAQFEARRQARGATEP
ncbi:MAG: hypothetical protein IID31_10280 [Planctomycetes bacterium]|nr:hypothetical protein [Planctomycetota bacterium]